jgi:hypothetical protein
VVASPLPEAMIDGLPRRKVGGQITSRAATLDDIQDGIQDAPPIRGRASAFGGFGQHGFEVGPLGVSETGVIFGVFHAPTEAALKMSRLKPSRMSTHPSIIRSLTPDQTRRPKTNPKPIIKTATRGKW